MAYIPKTNIIYNSIIQASDITNIIDSLNETGSYSINATGSFTGSFVGSHTGSFTGSYTGSYTGSFVGSFTGSFPAAGTDQQVQFNNNGAFSGFNTLTFDRSGLPGFGSILYLTGSLQVSGSITGSLLGTASYVLTSAGGGATFPYTGSALITGSLGITGSLLLTGSQTILGNQIISNILSLGNSVVASKDTIVDFNNLGDAGAGMFIIPDTSPTTPVNGAMYWDATGPGGTLYIYNLVAAAWESVTLS